MTLLLLGITLVLLMVDSAIELAFISNIVGYLHRSGANQYPFVSDNSTSSIINAKPAGLLLNKGHISNRAAVASLIVVCFSSFLVL